MGHHAKKVNNYCVLLSLINFVIDCPFSVATENVASISASATVLDGVSRSRNALLNGNTRDYDWDSGYTCHQLGSGSILIQLAQPYVISSMRLLLWDCDDRAYGYCIDVSCDQRSWSRVVDKSEESCQSWQVIQFSPRPVTFIKIIGTHNTANEVYIRFHGYSSYHVLNQHAFFCAGVSCGAF